jgi:molybdopterin-guanine dinucleotide biosynthesis protein A
VLAGGASRRLGGIPKGLVHVGNRRVIDLAAAALRDVTDTLVLAANDRDAGSWLPGVAVAADLHPGAGGLAGVEAAMRVAGGRAALVVAWDMPFVSAELLRLLVRSATEHDADVALPESPSPYGFEPFCAVYAARVLPALTAWLEAGGGAARDFLHAVPRLHRVPEAEIARVGDPARLFFSVNTPEDLAEARALVERSQ